MLSVAEAPGLEFGVEERVERWVLYADLGGRSCLGSGAVVAVRNAVKSQVKVNVNQAGATLERTCHCYKALWK